VLSMIERREKRKSLDNLTKQSVCFDCSSLSGCVSCRVLDNLTRQGDHPRDDKTAGELVKWECSARMLAPSGYARGDNSPYGRYPGHSLAPVTTDEGGDLWQGWRCERCDARFKMPDQPDRYDLPLMESVEVEDLPTDTVEMAAIMASAIATYSAIHPRTCALASEGPPAGIDAPRQLATRSATKPTAVVNRALDRPASNLAAAAVQTWLETGRRRGADLARDGPPSRGPGPRAQRLQEGRWRPIGPRPQLRAGTWSAGCYGPRAKPVPRGKMRRAVLHIRVTEHPCIWDTGIPISKHVQSRSSATDSSRELARRMHRKRGMKNFLRRAQTGES